VSAAPRRKLGYGEAMRRSPMLTVRVFCPHFERPVSAQRNEATERLVDCDSKGECATQETRESGVTVAVFPTGCPVFRG
jgi:hypothetical protein